MKKLVFSALCVLGFTASQAQVEFRPGLRTGVNFSHFTQSTNPNEKYSALSDFYLGLIGELDLSKVYSLQPEINYSRQGSKFEQRQPDNSIYKDEVKISYLSIGITNKFKFSKFNFYVGPSIDININDKGKDLTTQYNQNYYYYDNDITPVDFTFMAGVGASFTKNLGIDFRIKRGILDVYDFGNGDSGQNVVISAGVFYTFNTKK